jgi:Flp pilus assembly secretin CpaC
LSQDEPKLIEATVMDMPATTAASVPVYNDGTTHPILRLTQDKSEMIKLDQEAASVIVGNPNHVSVLLDTPDTLVVVPRAPGASHFSVIAEDGSVLMQRHVIVGAAKENYVRIRRSCNANSRNCQATSVYFCPDTCHEVQENLDGPSTRRR